MWKPSQPLPALPAPSPPRASEGALCLHQGFSCDQGKYYLALLMFNAPTSPLATPRPGSVPEAEAEEGGGDQPRPLGR